MLIHLAYVVDAKWIRPTYPLDLSNQISFREKDCLNGSFLWCSVHWKLTCLKFQLSLYLSVISIMEKNVNSLKNGKVVKLYLKILYALLPCDNCTNAVFQWCVPRGGFCPQEKETVRVLSFCPFIQPNTQRQMGDKELKAAVFLYVIYPGKNIPRVKCSCRSLKTFYEYLNLLFLHSCSFLPLPFPEVGSLKSHVLCSL